ncbi:nucleoporin Nup37-like [Ptychodera flava]|uniref:nucleoporin Nup37-like n=1 Tax=Ptychodera flava TaxID=63121 RepID=UPI00396A8460
MAIPALVVVESFSPHVDTRRVSTVALPCDTMECWLEFSLGVDEDSEIDDFEFEHLRDFHHGTRVMDCHTSYVNDVFFEPTEGQQIASVMDCHTSYVNDVFFEPTEGQQIASDEDSEINGFEFEHLRDYHHGTRVMDGHTSYVNDVVFEPTEGQQIASVSDDHTCRVWDLDGLQRACFPLYSPGMSVCWHSDEPAKNRFKPKVTKEIGAQL